MNPGIESAGLLLDQESECFTALKSSPEWLLLDFPIAVSEGRMSLHGFRSELFHLAVSRHQDLDGIRMIERQPEASPFAICPDTEHLELVISMQTHESRLRVWARAVRLPLRESVAGVAFTVVDIASPERFELKKFIAEQVFNRLVLRLWEMFPKTGRFRDSTAETTGREKRLPTVVVQ